MSSNAYELVIFGGNAGGLSVAVSMQEAGLEQVRILEPSSAVAFPELVGEHQLDVGYGETVQSIAIAAPSETNSDGAESGSDLIVTTQRHAYRSEEIIPTGAHLSLHASGNEF